MRILAINPGSTSTKIGIYNDENKIIEETIRHSSEELGKYNKISEEYEFRKDSVIKTLKDNNISIDDIDGFVGRGGLLKPISGGTYEVNEAMIRDLKDGVQGEHASNLGGLIAHELSLISSKKAYIVDPVVVDEMDEVAKVSGHPLFKRKSIFHALNQKAIGREYGKSINKRYEELNLIIAHLGGGISVGAHKRGMVVDVNNALDGEGPISPERSGTLPTGELAKTCFSNKYSYDEVKKIIKGKGGLIAYFNESNVKDLIHRAKEDNKIKLILEAMAYQVAKEIGSCAVVLDGEVNGIILTGGIAHNKYITDYIAKKVSFIGSVVVFPGEDEIRALVQGALRVLKGIEEPKIYF